MSQDFNPSNNFCLMFKVIFEIGSVKKADSNKNKIQERMY